MEPPPIQTLERLCDTLLSPVIVSQDKFRPMQSRPYPSKEDAVRIWLSRDEQTQLLNATDDPEHETAFRLGLHGLRSDELVEVRPRDLRPLNGDSGRHVLVIRDGKSGKREVPASEKLVDSIRYSRVDEDEPLVSVGKRTVRKWLASVRDDLAESDAGEWRRLSMHDLRRTWATDSFYSLAVEGVPIAEQLVMSWGGWKPTSTGRETFRRDYLGPVPDHVTREAIDYLPSP
jgi:integrase